MEFLGEETWDAVICGTGLQQSLLALALSRSSKRILHLDPNNYYGQHEATLSLREAESWAESRAGPGPQRDVFRHPSVWRHPDAETLGLSSPRAYALALAPQIIHTRSRLLQQLVSSRSYRQIEFLAVGSFFVYSAATHTTDAALARIPSSREDIFSSRAIPTRSKRQLMKFLKFVVDFDSEQRTVWQEHALEPLATFLATEFKLDEDLQTYLLALTLSLDGKVTVEQGLRSINRQLTSIGVFGPGFCAVYPKWGGLSEVAQAACRAGAVGGGVYMLATDVEVEDGEVNDGIPLKLSNGVPVRTRNLVTSDQNTKADGPVITRLVAVVNASLDSLFESTVEGAPPPAVAIVAFPAPFTDVGGGHFSEPVYALVHSSATGECPTGQTVIYLTIQATPQSSQRLENALDALLAVVSADGEHRPVCLYKLQYEQVCNGSGLSTVLRGSCPIVTFPSPSLGLSFEDGYLDTVKEAWKVVVGAAGEGEGEGEVLGSFMVFDDREGAGDDDQVSVHD
ncbi:GDP dissociation inhibitor-domain-containing protein [Xylariomycetidae sp. FL2044]|nr:GDP dissociation inhibitor-domain-containing protein [Xylariomycetidae sp. FL2044]